jgi:O-acetylhomoserine (thiol)-lyase
MTLSEAVRADQGDQERGFATLQLHSGNRPGSGVTPRATPIYLTAGFVLEDFDQAVDLFENGDGYTYTRVANPTAEAVEQKVALLERGAEALLVSSGQAAVAITLLGLLEAGLHLVSASSIYEGTRGFFLDNLSGRISFAPRQEHCSRSRFRIPRTTSSTLPRSPRSRTSMASR